MSLSRFKHIEKPRFNLSAVLDCSGTLCPVPILMTEEKMQEIEGGAILEVIFTDEGAKGDLWAWCRATGNEFLGFFDESKFKFLAYVRKK